MFGGLCREALRVLGGLGGEASALLMLGGLGWIMEAEHLADARGSRLRVFIFRFSVIKCIDASYFNFRMFKAMFWSPHLTT